MVTTGGRGADGGGAVLRGGCGTSRESNANQTPAPLHVSAAPLRVQVGALGGVVGVLLPELTPAYLRDLRVSVRQNAAGRRVFVEGGTHQALAKYLEDALPTPTATTATPPVPSEIDANPLSSPRHVCMASEVLFTLVFCSDDPARAALRRRRGFAQVVVNIIRAGARAHNAVECTALAVRLLAARRYAYKTALLRHGVADAVAQVLASLNRCAHVHHTTDDAAIRSTTHVMNLVATLCEACSPMQHGMWGAGVAAGMGGAVGWVGCGGTCENGTAAACPRRSAMQPSGGCPGPTSGDGDGAAAVGGRADPPVVDVGPLRISCIAAAAALAHDHPLAAAALCDAGVMPLLQEVLHTRSQATAADCGDGGDCATVRAPPPATTDIAGQRPSEGDSTSAARDTALACLYAIATALPHHPLNVSDAAASWRPPPPVPAAIANDAYRYFAQAAVQMAIAGCRNRAGGSDASGAEVQAAEVSAEGVQHRASAVFAVAGGVAHILGHTHPQPAHYTLDVSLNPAPPRQHVCGRRGVGDGCVDPSNSRCPAASTTTHAGPTSLCVALGVCGSVGSSSGGGGGSVIPPPPLLHMVHAATGKRRVLPSVAVHTVDKATRAWEYRVPPTTALPENAVRARERAEEQEEEHEPHCVSLELQVARPASGQLHGAPAAAAPPVVVAVFADAYNLERPDGGISLRLRSCGATTTTTTIDSPTRDREAVRGVPLMPHGEGARVVETASATLAPRRGGGESMRVPVAAVDVDGGVPVVREGGPHPQQTPRTHASAPPRGGARDHMLDGSSGAAVRQQHLGPLSVLAAAAAAGAPRGRPPNAAEAGGSAADLAMREAHARRGPSAKKADDGTSTHPATRTESQLEHRIRELEARLSSEEHLKFRCPASSAAVAVAGAPAAPAAPTSKAVTTMPSMASSTGSSMTWTAADAPRLQRGADAAPQVLRMQDVAAFQSPATAVATATAAPTGSLSATQPWHGGPESGSSGSEWGEAGATTTTTTELAQQQTQHAPAPDQPHAGHYPATSVSTSTAGARSLPTSFAAPRALRGRSTIPATTTTTTTTTATSAALPCTALVSPRGAGTSTHPRSTALLPSTGQTHSTAMRALGDGTAWPAVGARVVPTLEPPAEAVGRRRIMCGGGGSTSNGSCAAMGVDVVARGPGDGGLARAFDGGVAGTASVDGATEAPQMPSRTPARCLAASFEGAGVEEAACASTVCTTGEKPGPKNGGTGDPYGGCTPLAAETEAVDGDGDGDDLQDDITEVVANLQQLLAQQDAETAATHRLLDQMATLGAYAASERRC